MKNVLIVDDQPEMRQLYEDILSDKFESAELYFSPDGIDAFMKCAMMKYDAIILDHKMPRMKGIDLVVAIRNTPGPNQNTPILLISAHIPDEMEAKDIIKDVTFLNKPIDLNSLLENLETHLK